LQSVGDLGESEPVFILFLFGTERAGDRIDELRETLSSRLVAKDRTLERFGFAETEELIARWLAWAREEEYDSGYPSDPYTANAIETIVEVSDGTRVILDRSAIMPSELAHSSSLPNETSKSRTRR